MVKSAGANSVRNRTKKHIEGWSHKQNDRGRGEWQKTNEKKNIKSPSLELLSLNEKAASILDWVYKSGDFTLKKEFSFVFNTNDSWLHSDLTFLFEKKLDIFLKSPPKKWCCKNSSISWQLIYFKSIRQVEQVRLAAHTPAESRKMILWIITFRYMLWSAKKA